MIVLRYPPPQTCSGCTQAAALFASAAITLLALGLSPAHVSALYTERR